MPTCIGCDTTDNLRRMDLGSLEDELGPSYICPRCDDDATDMLAEFKSTPA